MEDVGKYCEKIRERRIRDKLRMIERARSYAAKYMYYLPDNPAKRRVWAWAWTDINRVSHIKMDTWEEVFLARESWARRHHDNIKMCSGACCGNGRRHHKSMTVQEAKAEEDARQQFEEGGYNYKGVRFCRYFF